MKRRRRRHWMPILGARSPGQALAETALLTTLMLGVGGALVHFFPDAINSMQIYIDGFYFTFSLPIP